MNWGTSGGLEPMALLRAYRSGQALPLLTDIGRPAQFLPPALPAFDYNAQWIAQRPAPAAPVYVPPVFTGMSGDTGGVSGDSGAAGNDAGGVGGIAGDSAPAGVASDGDSGGAGGGGGK